MEARRIWFEHVFNETKRAVVQAGKHSLRKYPLLQASLDDLIQDTYLELYKNYEKLLNHENITGWLVETMYRKARDRARRLYREMRRTAVPPEPDQVLERMCTNETDAPEQVYIRNENAQELHETLSQDIGEEGYRLLKSFYVDDVPLNTLANEAGTTPAALKMRFYRWKRRIQRKRTELKR